MAGMTISVKSEQAGVRKGLMERARPLVWGGGVGSDADNYDGRRFQA